MLSNEKNQPAPGAATTAQFSNTPLDLHGGTNQPYARTLRLQSVLAVLVLAMASNEHTPLTHGDIIHMGYLTRFAFFESELIASEIEEITEV